MSKKNNDKSKKRKKKTRHTPKPQQYDISYYQCDPNIGSVSCYSE